KTDPAQQKADGERGNPGDGKPQGIFADGGRHIPCKPEDKRKAGPCRELVAAGGLIDRRSLRAVARYVANRLRGRAFIRGHDDSPQLQAPPTTRLKNCDPLSIQRSLEGRARAQAPTSRGSLASLSIAFCSFSNACTSIWRAGLRLTSQTWLKSSSL